MTLGGIIFIRNGWQFDYCFRESIECLREMCDQVVILDAGSDDTTDKTVQQYEDTKTTVICLDKEEWEKQQGREKLAYFQNLALSFLGTDYYFLLQGDEIVSEHSFGYIREAIATDREAFYCTRINLWRDCNSYINVPENRQPCSTQVIRLAKTNYKSVGDGESIQANASDYFLKQIEIFHMGFVRRKEVMINKIKNMQINVFRLPEFDPKMNDMDVFKWDAWFSDSELSPINKPLPKFITKWASTRP